jgi:sulfate/thiosulfate transport system substrate-binding protein
MSTDRSPRRRAVAWLAVATAAAIGVSACSSSKSSSGGSGGKVAIVGYSVPKPAYTALETAFAATTAGKDVKFSESFGPSGSQSKAVAAGQPADYVNFSVGSDLTKLVPTFVAADWDAGATKGIVSDSVVAIVVKKGNPKHITGWDDLIKPGVQIVTPDPASSGSAKWNILAAYEHVISNGGTPVQAAAYLKAFFQHVVAKPSSGSNAMTTFTSGTGDALISYEAEAISARQKGQSVDYIVPNESVLIETPAAVTLKGSQAAKDFLAFALTTQGQQIFASKGFRPAVAGVAPGTVQGANDPANPYPTVAKLTTISQLGGWSTVNKTFFDPDTGIVTKIEAQTG